MQNSLPNPCFGVKAHKYITFAIKRNDWHLAKPIQIAPNLPSIGLFHESMDGILMFGLLSYFHKRAFAKWREYIFVLVFDVG